MAPVRCGSSCIESKYPLLAAVERLMRQDGLRGVVRGRRKSTTIAHDGKPLDCAQRRFMASRPDELWVADFTFVATWAGLCMLLSPSTFSLGGSSVG